MHTEHITPGNARFATLDELVPLGFPGGLESLGGDEAREWDAMQRAGQAVGRAIVEDAQESRVLPGSPRFLVLVGKGHNGGDALIAARTLLELRPDGATRVEVVFVFGERSLRPLAARAWRDLAQQGGTRVRVVPATAMAGVAASSPCATSRSASFSVALRVAA